MDDAPLWPEWLARHEAAWDAEIAEDEAAAREREIGTAIAALHRAAHECRLGYPRDGEIRWAILALRRAGLHEMADRVAEIDPWGGGEQELIDELQAMKGGQ